MRYFIEITRNDSPPDSEEEAGMPTYRLPQSYDSLEEAAEAALAYIDASGLPLGALMFNIVNSEGQSVITSEETES